VTPSPTRFWWAPWLAVLLASPGVAVWVAQAGWPLRPAAGWGLLWALMGSPWLEEVVYRSAVQRPVFIHLKANHAAWSDTRAGWVASAVAMLCFVAVHAPAHGWFALAWAVPALTLGELFRQTQRVLPCVVLHAWFNASLYWASL